MIGCKLVRNRHLISEVLNGTSQFRTIAPMNFKRFALTVFLSAIFIGDLWLVKVTLPIAILWLPFLFLSSRRVKLPVAGAWYLILLLALVAFQHLTGRTLAWRSDIIIWSPILFALLTLFVLGPFRLSSETMRSAMMTGGFITAAIMLGMIFFVPGGSYLIPGQDLEATSLSYRARQMHLEETARRKNTQSVTKQASEAAPRTAQPAPESEPDRPEARDALPPVTLSSGQAPDVAQSQVDGTKPTLIAPHTSPKAVPIERPMSEATKEFYQLKNRARSFLGGSNYIAVFFVFLFAVALYSGQTLNACLMASLTLITLSRFGIALLLVIFCLRWLSARGLNAVSVARFSLVLSAAIFAGLYLLRSVIAEFVNIPSVLIRFDLLNLGLKTIESRPFIGAMRSLVLAEQNLDITWNPHNSIVWLIVNFGFLGLVFYAAYVFTALKAVANAAKSSDVWTGVLIGLVILLVWSLQEVIVLTPAFEILFATMYALALNARSRTSSRNNLDANVVYAQHETRTPGLTPVSLAPA